MTAEREQLARVENEMVIIGKTLVADVGDNIADVLAINAAAEQWYQSRSKPLVEALRAVEFVDSEYDGQCESVCPWCYGSESRGTGHKKTCLRQQALEAHNAK